MHGHVNIFWPSNVFGNRAFYGVGFRVIGCSAYLLHENYRPRYATNHEWVFEEHGLVITHILVTFNRSVNQGHSRERFFLTKM